MHVPPRSQTVNSTQIRVTSRDIIRFGQHRERRARDRQCSHVNLSLRERPRHPIRIGRDDLTVSVSRHSSRRGNRATDRGSLCGRGLSTQNSDLLACEPCVKNECKLYGVPKCMQLIDELQIIAALSVYLPHA